MTDGLTLKFHLSISVQIGLAVGDVKTAYEQAELYTIASQVNKISISLKIASLIS